MRFSDKVYNVLKWTVLIGMPAAEALWLGISQVWGWPYVIEIGTSIALATAFLGTLIGISNYNYNKTEQKDDTF